MKSLKPMSRTAIRLGGLAAVALTVTQLSGCIVVPWHRHYVAAPVVPAPLVVAPVPAPVVAVAPAPVIVPRPIHRRWWW